MGLCMLVRPTFGWLTEKTSLQLHTEKTQMSSSQQIFRRPFSFPSSLPNPLPGGFGHLPMASRYSILSHLQPVLLPLLNALFWTDSPIEETTFPIPFSSPLISFLPWGPLELPAVIHRVTKNFSWPQTLSISHNSLQPEFPSRHLLPGCSPSSHCSGFQKVSKRGSTLLFSMASSRLSCLPTLHLFMSSLLQRPPFFLWLQMPQLAGYLPSPVGCQTHQTQETIE